MKDNAILTIIVLIRFAGLASLKLFMFLSFMFLVAYFHSILATFSRFWIYSFYLEFLGYNGGFTC